MLELGGIVEIIVQSLHFTNKKTETQERVSDLLVSKVNELLSTTLSFPTIQNWDTLAWVDQFFIFEDKVVLKTGLLKAKYKCYCEAKKKDKYT